MLFLKEHQLEDRTENIFVICFDKVNPIKSTLYFFENTGRRHRIIVAQICDKKFCNEDLKVWLHY